MCVPLRNQCIWDALRWWPIKHRLSATPTWLTRCLLPMPLSPRYSVLNTASVAPRRQAHMWTTAPTPRRDSPSYPFMARTRIPLWQEQEAHGQADGGCGCGAVRPAGCGLPLLHLPLHIALCDGGLCREGHSPRGA